MKPLPVAAADEVGAGARPKFSLLFVTVLPVTAGDEVRKRFALALRVFRPVLFLRGVGIVALSRSEHRSCRIGASSRSDHKCPAYVVCVCCGPKRPMRVNDVTGAKCRLVT